MHLDDSGRRIRFWPLFLGTPVFSSRLSSGEQRISIIGPSNPGSGRRDWKF